jgi:hypothetical protein
VEFIRFALLLTITAALISIALRHDDSDGSRPQASHGNASASPSPAGGGSSSAPASEQPTTGSPSSGASSSDGLDSGGSTDNNGNGTSDGSEGTAEGSDGAGSDASGATGDDGSVPTLPRTGGTQAAELAALAMLFIAAGTAGVRLSRPSARQPAVGSTALTHPGHAEGSSESNLPGTD